MTTAERIVANHARELELIQAWGQMRGGLRIEAAPFGKLSVMQRNGISLSLDRKTVLAMILGK